LGPGNSVACACCEEIDIDPSTRHADECVDWAAWARFEASLQKLKSQGLIPQDSFIRVDSTIIAALKERGVTTRLLLLNGGDVADVNYYHVDEPLFDFDANGNWNSTGIVPFEVLQQLPMELKQVPTNIYMDIPTLHHLRNPPAGQSRLAVMKPDAIMQRQLNHEETVQAHYANYNTRDIEQYINTLNAHKETLWEVAGQIRNLNAANDAMEADIVAGVQPQAMQMCVDYTRQLMQTFITVNLGNPGSTLYIDGLPLGMSSNNNQYEAFNNIVQPVPVNINPGSVEVRGENALQNMRNKRDILPANMRLI
jgi:hypothetical protein